MKSNELIYIPDNIWIEINNFKNCVILAHVEIFKADKKSLYNFNEYVNFINNNN